MLKLHNKGLGVLNVDVSKQASLRCRPCGHAPSTSYFGHFQNLSLRPSCEAPRQDAICCSISSRQNASLSRGAPLRMARSSSAKGRRLTVTHSKRGRGGSDGEDLGNQNFGISQSGNGVDITVLGNKFSVNRDNLWTLAVPAVGVLALATTIGPIVIGLVFAAGAVGAALSFGAFALSFLWIPVLLAGLGVFIVPGILFGGFANLGFGLFGGLIGKLIGLVSGHGLSLHE
ncbi:hypothetical protein DUNSADRAFT_2470 [Dunaliella salina]|uniref:Uncharacterized protein n=1 Tax=Dunaliella salina TaxID=3046 RepID=A0ABQ7GVK9_DUNSA|nr:hypothetical protein DUNSADRAFT_2470 [Dunaliella salina]|eukprot:KAF5838635.1 hypothetical protein DUNSADRAFT_2470 [Dunaliella salina]